MTTEERSAPLLLSQTPKTGAGKARRLRHTRNLWINIPESSAGMMSPVALARLLEDMEESHENILGASGLDPTLSVQLPPKVTRCLSDPQINFV